MTESWNRLESSLAEQEKKTFPCGIEKKKEEPVDRICEIGYILLSPATCTEVSENERVLFWKRQE
ncbi:MAG: hypothetical protein C4527_00025 [Candidatus Omnitrophota bacterium]|nr:MAG: hypothetical protein C4527_00025 [Candidatus Omnitrophota bacterium]